MWRENNTRSNVGVPSRVHLLPENLNPTSSSPTQCRRFKKPIAVVGQVSSAYHEHEHHERGGDGDGKDQTLSERSRSEMRPTTSTTRGGDTQTQKPGLILARKESQRCRDHEIYFKTLMLVLLRIAPLLRRRHRRNSFFLAASPNRLAEAESFLGCWCQNLTPRDDDATGACLKGQGCVGVARALLLWSGGNVKVYVIALLCCSGPFAATGAVGPLICWGGDDEELKDEDGETAVDVEGAWERDDEEGNEAEDSKDSAKPVTALSPHTSFLARFVVLLVWGELI